MQLAVGVILTQMLSTCAPVMSVRTSNLSSELSCSVSRDVGRLSSSSRACVNTETSDAGCTCEYSLLRLALVAQWTGSPVGTYGQDASRHMLQSCRWQTCGTIG